MTTPPWFRLRLAGANFHDRALAALGAVAGIALTAIICGTFMGEASASIVAPMGASAVLAFAVPSSPLAQPRAVILGNIVGALFGVAVHRLLGDGPLSAGVAVGGAIFVMTLLRCLHPPGGASALLAVIGGPSVEALGFGFALVPIGHNAIALTLVAMIFHRLRNNDYPHRAQVGPAAPMPVAPRADIEIDDIDAALDDMGEAFDITREDLELLFRHAEAHAAIRRQRADAAEFII